MNIEPEQQHAISRNDDVVSFFEQMKFADAAITLASCGLGIAFGQILQNYSDEVSQKTGVATTVLSAVRGVGVLIDLCYPKEFHLPRSTECAISTLVNSIVKLPSSIIQLIGPLTLINQIDRNKDTPIAIACEALGGFQGISYTINSATNGWQR